MLRPQNRRYLLDLLRPPDGYTLDRAIGTTFSLDLLALLTAPLAFTIFDQEDETGLLSAGPLALLETMRRYADRIAIFCQSGQIAVPRTSQLLFGYLEQSVFEVLAPRQHGVFHPKVWLLRFVHHDGAVLYRMLCLSRNLTFDHSWDTALMLEGRLGDDSVGQSDTQPLADFIAALPGLSKRPPPGQVKDAILRIAEEMRGVHFQLPDGFRKLQFWPLGLASQPAWPFEGQIDRMLVVSPFLTGSLLQQLRGWRTRDLLISRGEALVEMMPGDLAGYGSIFTLADEAEPEPGVEESDSMQVDDVPVGIQAADVLVGLHAKLYVADAGSDARVWTGSPNATQAAFNNNVEFLVELTGDRRIWGIDALLPPKGREISLADLLQPFRPSETPPVIDTEQARLERIAESFHRRFVAGSYIARVGDGGQPDLFNVQLRTSGGSVPAFGAEVRLTCRPVTISPTAKVSVSSGSGIIATFCALSFEALTTFFAFELVARSKTRMVSRHFVLNIPLEGAPDDRRERILQVLLRSREQLLRFLMLLLAEGRTDVEEIVRAAQRLGTSEWSEAQGLPELPLFEAMMRALDHDPAKLDQIARLIADLRKTPQGRQLVPDDFDAIWAPIWGVREELQP